MTIATPTEVHPERLRAAEAVAEGMDWEAVPFHQLVQCRRNRVAIGVERNATD